ncbi:DUF4870 domain-containing protein [Actinotalea sp.]|uniref:DUF4870 domain-containing protein n=1 Tax=Actinotalea sp. TaxID=1872145 RepID=UPI00356420F3
MTTTPPEEPQGSETPPTPPPPAGRGATPPPSYQAPAGGYQAPPPGYQPPPPAYGSAPVGAPLSDSDQRMWATIAHIGPIIVSFLAPLVIWLVFKGRGQFVEEQAKEALNFQITVAIAAVAVSIITAITLGIGGILYLAFIAALVFMVMGAIAANKGEAYRYPLNWRLIK